MSLSASSSSSSSVQVPTSCRAINVAVLPIDRINTINYHAVKSSKKGYRLESIPLRDWMDGQADDEGEQSGESGESGKGEGYYLGNRVGGLGRRGRNYNRPGAQQNRLTKAQQNHNRTPTEPHPDPDPAPEIDNAMVDN